MIVVVRDGGHLRLEIVRGAFVFVRNRGALGKIVVAFVFVQVDSERDVGVVFVAALGKDDAVHSGHVFAGISGACALHHHVAAFVVRFVRDRGRSLVALVRVGVPDSARERILVAVFEVIDVVRGARRLGAGGDRRGRAGCRARFPRSAVCPGQEFVINVFAGSGIAALGPVHGVRVGVLPFENRGRFALVAHGPVAPGNLVVVEEGEPFVGIACVHVGRGEAAVRVSRAPFGDEHGAPRLNGVADTVPERGVAAVVAAVELVGISVKMECVGGVVAAVRDGVADRFFGVGGVFAVAHDDQVRAVLADHGDDRVRVAFDCAPHTGGVRFVEYFEDHVRLGTPFLGHVSEERRRFGDFVLRRVRMVVDDDINVFCNRFLDDRVIERLPVGIEVARRAVRDAEDFDFPFVDEGVDDARLVEVVAHVPGVPEHAHALYLDLGRTRFCSVEMSVLGGELPVIADGAREGK